MFNKSARFMAVAVGVALPLSVASADISRQFNLYCDQPAYDVLDDQGQVVGHFAEYHGVYPVNLSSINGQWAQTGATTWTLTTPWLFTDPDDGETVRGRIDSMTINYADDPMMSLSFGVTAGAASTSFTMNSPSLTFPTLQNPTVAGRATVGFAITDSLIPPPNGNGGTLTGLYGGLAYEARYNTSSVFTPLLLSSPYGQGTTTLTDSTPGYLVPVFLPIPGNVSEINTSASFVLSARDQASVTSEFEIIGQVPAPGAMSLLGLGALAVRRRRSR